MTRTFFLFGIVLVLLAPFMVAAQEADEITVDRIAICTAVADREPQGEGTEFDTTVERLYCFTALNGAAGQVVHAWYQGDSLRAKVTLDKGQAGRWRTYSNKQMAPEWQGKWRVDVLDENGNVLKSAEFTYGKAEGQE
ncbi:DUF2914 domain-containing protein [candidate division KSB1 bacterium]|nr:DUF2914 domain-containing protein [candidate division KSB1 bacterium]